jgi:hypothetical protein
VGLASSVQGTIAAIVEALGAEYGAFSGSIGVRDKSYVVDPTGQGRTKGRGTQKFKTEAEAEAALLRDALADGAVAGISEAVRKALNSSSDIDKALREALKLNELEDLLSGVGGEGEKALREFDRQAKERVRIAAKYGFDLVKLEEVNAKERAKLVEDILESSIGPLQDLLDSLSFGDLFEGTASEQRQKLLLEIAKAETDARAGVAGATDKVAALSRQLLEVSREGFGTAGPEYAADMASTKTAAEELIRLENERVNSAVGEAKTTNLKLDENNDQNAVMIGHLRKVELLLERAVSGGGGAAVARGGGISTGFAGDLR